MKPQDRLYLDYNAGAPTRPVVLGVVSKVFETFGNPSSVHGEGRSMRQFVENSRQIIGEHLACQPNQIIFTSSATEAANHALSPVIKVSGKETQISKLFVSATEHPCILAGGRFSSDNIEVVPVVESGVVNLDALEDALGNHDTDTGAPMVAVMLANNETGVIQPVGDVSELVRRHGGYLLVDAVQGLGKVDFSLDELDADFILLSSHKIGGPQGAGALVLGSEAVVPAPLLKGGGQEGFNRAGTENVAAIAGFGAAAESLPGAGQIEKISVIRDSIEEGLVTISMEMGEVVDAPVILGRNAERLPNTCCFAVPGIKAETALISLDLAGIAVSSGSACSSGKVRKSHVLSAMGASDDLAGSALRISLGPDNELEDSARFLDAWRNIVRNCIRDEIRMAV
ncbi:MAG: cysteine desulfurase family protein [Rhizobiaceae bacterium]